MAHTFCCNHPQIRMDSPEPPARAPTIIIDGLLTAAALPEDHPHAFQFPDKKPAIPGGILRSPSIANKIKSQLWRRSSRVGSNSGEGCDEDAKDVSEAEVEGWVGGMFDGEAGELMEKVVERGTPDGMRTPVMSDLEWLEPLVRRPCASSDRSEITPRQSSVAQTVAVDTPSTDPGIPRSTSYPNLSDSLDVDDTAPHRTKLSENDHHPSQTEAHQLVQAVGNDEPVQSTYPPLDEKLPMRMTTQLEAAELDPFSQEGRDTQRSTQSKGVHLQDLRISQQLRSMSAGSWSTDCDSMSSICDVKPWNFHHRKTSTLGGGSIHRRRGSGCVITMPSQLSVGRVRSPATSSTYSQGSAVVAPNFSAVVDEDVGNEAGAIITADEPSGLDGALLDWPLPRQENLVDIGLATEIERLAETTPFVAKTSVTNLSITSTGAETSTVRWSTPPARTVSVPKPSSSHFSTSSKRSKFFERFSPAKRLVRKRRSIFKFLRPGSRKQQGRSISSPLLHVPASSTLSAYDGPQDDPSLMTVAYETVDQPPASRSASMGNLVQDHRPSAAHLAVPDALQRRPSLADYERVLTAAGDDRRRPSTIDLVKLKEVQEDDRRQSTSLRRRLSRAKPLDEDHTGPRGLMTQAAERTLQEKALFRSASKRREAIAVAHDDRQHPLFRTDTLTSVAASTPAANTTAVSDLLDPLDMAVGKPSIGRSHSAGYLMPPGVAGVEQTSRHNFVPPSIKPSFSSSSPLAQVRQNPIAEGAPVRIGTAPAAWSQFPSHTRLERSGPAGDEDDVITRDFAVQEETRESHELPDLPNTSPISISKHAVGRKNAFAKKRSTTFGGIKRFYSNVFTSGFSPSNRRSSVATGGWLANPDLELLPPTTSHEPAFPHHDHHFKQHLHDLERELEERVAKDIEFVEDEAAKIGEQIREDVNVAEEEAEKFMHINPYHHHEHYHGKQAVGGQFGNDNPFAPGLEHVLQKRHSSFVSPLDEEDGPTSPAGDGSVAAASTAGPPPIVTRVVSHDGASDTQAQQHKAETWSSTYKDCLTHSGSSVTPTSTSTPMGTLRGMPPPQLKPVKARSSDKNKGLDPNATVRRFPSVTVVDDRKGHGHSISLLSVKLEGDGIMRSSTNDLLQLIEDCERQERERLLRGPSRASERSGRQYRTVA
ncbi:hypothetical protein LTR78_006374 [Recurvomyces mirabilis]|uniref:Uncharacterized protein n=1 Tax=Recurvomyces mirabilis TaxID=574656 RepID=A0AAE0WLC4_9PEZI|nr:hypothetical protein LTR78_006374 [Recurvomyces mirabilis]KAK5152261.1 hypothetical protein LTS14_008638 [Recurvomyces mirabilis]